MNEGDLITTDTDVLFAEQWVYDVISAINMKDNLSVIPSEDGEGDLIISTSVLNDSAIINQLMYSPFIEKDIDSNIVLENPDTSEKRILEEWFTTKKYKYIFSADI